MVYSFVFPIIGLYISIVLSFMLKTLKVVFLKYFACELAKFMSSSLISSILVKSLALGMRSARSDARLKEFSVIP